VLALASVVFASAPWMFAWCWCLPATTNICNICHCLKMVHSLTLHNFKILVDQNRSNWWFLASLTGQTDKWW
jgi:hypothetical protein